ncbi:hypothetical protein HK101_004915, partial [Irineochytrium annulatum]
VLHRDGNTITLRLALPLSGGSAKTAALKQPDLRLREIRRTHHVLLELRYRASKPRNRGRAERNGEKPQSGTSVQLGVLAGDLGTKKPAPAQQAGLGFVADRTLDITYTTQ